jgi:replicative DNA helicase
MAASTQVGVPMGTVPLPPQNLEAEEYVLGAMMLSAQAIEVVSDVIDGGDFYRESHAKIYRAALDLFQHGHPVDAITVADKLDENGELEEIGGKERIREIATLVPATSNAGHHARIVREMATLRGLTVVGEGIQRLGWERPGETPELVDRAEQMVFDLAQHRIRGSFEHIEVLVRETFEQITKMYESGGQMTGTPTGFRDIDSMTSGLQPGNLIVVAGRPSMGKSAFALGMASNLALHHGIPVAVFTLEMSKVEVAQRLMCSEGRVELQRLRTGRLSNEDWPRLVKACDALTKAPIYVDDTRLTTMLEIRGKARRLKAREPNLGLIMIDYLQLMTSGSNAENRVQEVSQISRSLKVLAGDLEVPVLALSQLSRAVESRTDKRPLLSDLRESGCLSGESRVYLPDEGVYRTMRELVGTSGFRVLAVDTDTWKLEPRVVTNAFSTGVKPVYRLTTRRGQSIRATGNHKFLAFDGWRRLDDLAPGMRLAAPRTLTGPNNSTMTADELALLGHLIGDGCTLPRHAIQYTSKDEDLAEHVAELATEVFGDAVNPRVTRERTWFQTYLPASRRLTHGVRNPIAAWLDELGAFGLRAPEKHVPARVFEQGSSGIATFLRHLWATDGCVWPGRNGHYPAVRYGSSSERLTRDVQSLLLRLGISSTRSAVSMGARGLPMHNLSVVGKANLERFVSEVGGVGMRKRTACAELQAQLDQLAERSRDTLPIAAWRTIVFPAMTRAGVRHRDLWASINVACSGSSVYTRGMSRGRASMVATAVRSEPLEALATSDVYWDEIVSVEPDGEEEVFDLTVDGLHNFVAEDICAHNSIEQDSDLVMFLYRDEYYNDQSEDQGLAEVILAKHRNGPIGTEKLAFLKRFAKFSDLAPQHDSRSAAA